MLRKLISIRNIGRFSNYSASGDIDFRRSNLILAENGRGKTTLCAILRSLETGDPALVKGRTTLGAANPAEIKILLADASTADFANGAWTATVPNIAVFDSTFVSENVYSGDAVDLDHKRRLHSVIVGKAGADMARGIDQLDGASRDKNPEIREKRAAVEALALGLTPEEFLALPADPVIDQKIAAQERDLAAVRQADQIRTRAPLSMVTVPEPPAGIAAILAKTLEGVAADAERRVTAQVEAHAMHGRGRGWLSEGLGYVLGDTCPFCGQRLEGLALIAAYRAYFSEAYNALRAETADLRGRVETTLSDRAIAAVERLIDQNTAATEFWSAYCEFPAPTLTGAGAGDVIRTLREAALALLNRKAASPLEPVAPDQALTAAEAAMAGVQDAVAVYNAAVAAVNIVIEAKKAATVAADIRAVQTALTRLQAVKARHDTTGAGACLKLVVAMAEKDAIEGEKVEVRRKLDEYAGKVMAQYEKTINGLLAGFQCVFRTNVNARFGRT